MIHKCKNGDSASFKPLMNIYKNRLFSYLMRKADSRDEAEDIMQEVLIKVWKGLPKYKEENRFSSWLFSIAYNAVIDAGRKKNSSIINSDEDIGITNNGPFENFVALETNKIIENALSLLTDNQKEVFLLRQHGELSFKEISKKLDQPLNTVISHMHYAVKKLKKTLRQKDVI
ncbi:MAG: RNA polymerase sigma factor [Melioribacteraceae bacterium]|nr:RNA polymerase sigma factor [Melioribacteraceae bacterium]